MKNKGTIITVSVCLVIIIALAIYFFVFKKNKTATSSSISSIPSSGSSSSSSGSSSSAILPVVGLYTDSSYPLRRNSGGNRVKALQLGLNLTYGAGLTVDGKFGSNTENACRTYLKATAVTQSMMGQLIIDDKYRQYV